MNITLPREQQEWLEAQVRAGAYESIDEAVASIVAEYRQLGLGPDGLDWAKPLVDEARAAIERGDYLTLKEHRARMDDLIKSFRGR
jgi:antitoxin ParD1/3/4